MTKQLLFDFCLTLNLFLIHRSPNIYSPMAVRLYYPTHVRGAPYLIGIILGYHIYYKDQKAQEQQNNVSIFLSIIY